VPCTNLLTSSVYTGGVGNRLRIKEEWGLATNLYEEEKKCLVCYFFCRIALQFVVARYNLSPSLWVLDLMSAVLFLLVTVFLWSCQCGLIKDYGPCAARGAEECRPCNGLGAAIALRRHICSVDVVCFMCAGCDPYCTWKRQLNKDAADRHCRPTNEQKPRWLNEFDEAIEAGKPVVSKLATALAD